MRHHTTRARSPWHAPTGRGRAWAGCTQKWGIRRPWPWPEGGGWRGHSAGGIFCAARGGACVHTSFRGAVPWLGRCRHACMHACARHSARRRLPTATHACALGAVPLLPRKPRHSHVPRSLACARACMHAACVAAFILAAARHASAKLPYGSQRPRRGRAWSPSLCIAHCWSRSRCITRHTNRACIAPRPWVPAPHDTTRRTSRRRRRNIAAATPHSPAFANPGPDHDTLPSTPPHGVTPPTLQTQPGPTHCRALSDDGKHEATMNSYHEQLP